MSKRPNAYADITKLEDISEQIKRQIPLSYTTPNNALSTMSSSSLLLHSNMKATTTATHNGLAAIDQTRADLLRATNNGMPTVEERVKSIIPPCRRCNDIADVIKDERVGAYICTRCGLETGRLIIEGAEWRNFGDGENSRVVAEDAGGGYENVVRNEDGKKTAEQRRLAKATGVLDSLRTALKTPDNIFHAARKLVSQYLSAPIDIIGRSVKADTLAAACFYDAALDLGNPIRKEDIIIVLSLTEKKFNKSRKRLGEVRTWHAQKNDKEIPISDPIKEACDYLNKFSKKFDLPRQTIDAASCIIKTAYELNIHRGSKATTTAAAALLFTTKLQEHEINAHELARQAQTTLDTVRKQANDYYLRREALVPDNFVDPLQIAQMAAP